MSISSYSEDNTIPVKKTTLVDGDNVKLFDPPLYQQRYDTVLNILLEKGCRKVTVEFSEHFTEIYKVVKVVDFGCAECKFIEQLKLKGNFEKIIGVDVLKDTLISRKYVCQPVVSDYVVHDTGPLQMSLYHGSLIKYDSRVKVADAVTLIEVIEHLEDDILRKLPEAVFGKLHPQFVIITTPNSEYNVVFDNFSGMRHWDHKFEWTRKEFQDWCGNITQLYGYDVCYGGIGEPPAANSVIGYCSQMAVFTRNKQCISDIEHVEEIDERHVYSEIISCDFPYRVDSRNHEEKARHEITYVLTVIGQHSEADCDGCLTIELDHMMQFKRLRELFNESKDDVREVLKNSGFTITDDGQSVLYPIFPESDSENDDGSISDNDSYESPFHGDGAHILSFTEEPWDVN